MKIEQSGLHCKLVKCGKNLTIGIKNKRFKPVRNAECSFNT